MALPIRRRAHPHDTRPGVVGPARVDRRTEGLTKRLQPGDVAVIDHADLDKVSADALVSARPAAVVNASASITGRYPNLGPQILVGAGIPLLDQSGPEVMTLADGQLVRLDGADLWLGERPVAAGSRPHAGPVQARTARAR